MSRNLNAVCVASSIGGVVEAVLSKIPKKPRYTSLFSNWKEIVGEDFSHISAPYKIVIQNNRKILVLKSRKGCSVELQHCSQQILKRVHDFLGRSVFSFVKVIQLDIDDDF